MGGVNRRSRFRGLDKLDILANKNIVKKSRFFLFDNELRTLSNSG